MAETTEKRYAILIGSSKYPDEPGLTELRCPENDVDALDAVLRSPDFGGFTETFVFKNQPSHEILEKIETVLADAGRDDLVLIYFSGHGKTSTGPLCLATTNTKIKALGSTSIPVATIKTFFYSSDIRKKVLILDCCFSGSAGKIFTKGGVDDQLRVVSEGEGTFIMTASARFQAAFEKEGDQYSLFTKHLVEGIQTGKADKNKDGLVDMQELYEYVHEKVRGEEGAQEPMKWDLHVKGIMIIAKSGKVAKEKRRQEMEQGLHRFAADGLLTSRIVNEAVHIIFLPEKEMTAKDRECILLIEQLVSDELPSADFIVRWIRVTEPRKNWLSLLKKIGSTEFIEQWMRIVVPKKIWIPLLVLLLALLCMYIFLKQGGVQKASESPLDPAQETLSPAPVVQNDPLEQTYLSGLPDEFHEQIEGVIEQSATILVSPPVVPLPKEEPEKPLIIVDDPKKKKVVVNTEQMHTEDILEYSAASQSKQGDTMTDSITGMEFVSIPKGCFQMGSPENERGRYKNEGPVHKVCVDDFWIGKYEVTQGQWKKIMKTNPSIFKKGKTYPVENVSWEDMQKFIDELNIKSGKKYRLPTEAEWEYAARAGTNTSRYWGDYISCDKAMYENDQESNENRCIGHMTPNSTAPVGSYPANQFGLYDILGNVWEWCADWYGSYPSGSQDNPIGPSSGSGHVFRGGSWNSGDQFVRSAERNGYVPFDRNLILGFRLVLPVQQNK